MKYSIPHNWQSDLTDTLKSLNIDDVYGKLASDVIGGGRPSYGSIYVSRKKFKLEVRKVKEAGLKFVYLLNCSCLDNIELSYLFKLRLNRFLVFLQKSAVDAVCVGSPYLALYIRKHFPGLEIHASVAADIDSPAKAIWWQEAGAVKLTLSESSVNRNFKLLEDIRSAVDIKIQLIANNCCMQNCPFVNFHANGVAHASRNKDALGGFFLDYYRLRCNMMRFKDKSLFLKADWIRPEDVSLYEKAGVDSLKIVNRSMDTASLFKILKAYNDRKYVGNLADLLPSYAKDLNYRKISIYRKLYYFFAPLKVNVFKLKKLQKAVSMADVYIDNQKLDGFLEEIIKRGCGTLCNNCSYCTDKAEEAVTVKNFPDCSDIITEMENGSFYRYLNFGKR